MYNNRIGSFVFHLMTNCQDMTSERNKKKSAIYWVLSFAFLITVSQIQAI